MFQLRQGAGVVVAGDIRNAVTAVDDALLNSARLYVSVLEATQGSDLPAAQTQRLFRSITSGLTSVVDGRAEMVAAVKQMAVIKSRSNFAPENYGCPDGWEDFAAMGSLDAPGATTSAADARLQPA